MTVIRRRLKELSHRAAPGRDTVSPRHNDVGKLRKSDGIKSRDLGWLAQRGRLFTEFLKHPRQVATILPSSRFLERRITEIAGIAAAGTIVELGAGTGGTTREILRAMSDDAKLLSIEINPRLFDCLASIDDDRLISHVGSAERLQQALSSYGLGNPDAVISGIPFSVMHRERAMGVLQAIARALSPGGHFVAYQVSRRIVELGRPCFGVPHIVTELRNFPPVRIYHWRKPLTGSRGANPVASWGREDGDHAVE